MVYDIISETEEVRRKDLDKCIDRLAAKTRMMPGFFF